MHPERVRLAQRLAALESFREEHLRQELTAAHQVAAGANAQLEQRKARLAQVEASREQILASAAVAMGHYALYGELAVQMTMEVEQAAEAREKAKMDIDAATASWCERRARRDATDMRAQRLIDDALRECERYRRENDLELWLGRNRVRS